jgi:hypothetical protein
MSIDKFVALRNKLRNKTGQRRKGLDASPQWHKNISFATDLLEKKYKEYSVKI